MEIWRCLKNINHKYYISNYGRLCRMMKDGSLKLLKGCVNPKGYIVHSIRVNGEKTMFRQHMLVAECFISGYKKGIDLIDHINGDRADNRVENLRTCNFMQNNYNTGINKNNTSGFKGVDFMKSKGKWRASIRVNKTPIFIGLFNSPEEAARAYDSMATKKFGEFARTNKMIGTLN